MHIDYASDVHGSKECWKRFLAAPKYYEADVIIMGGDITGKFIVPIVRLPNGRADHAGALIGVCIPAPAGRALAT
jgi:Icc-related predicted phosphoesterase